ncbi:MAG: EVE domain-containing protein [Chloroflexota bacterium]
MKVRYADGMEAELNIAIQERIWENIVAEREARAGDRSHRAANKDTTHYIKVVNIPPGEELAFPGWAERVVMVPDEDQATRIKAGDRFIYYAREAQTFFAVVTITGEVFTASPKQYTYTTEDEKAHFFNVDVDAASTDLEHGVSVESIELESYPNLRRQHLEAEAFYRISEDDFELLAEALTEVTEDEEEDTAAYDEYEDEEIE